MEVVIRSVVNERTQELTKRFRTCVNYSAALAAIRHPKWPHASMLLELPTRSTQRVLSSM